MAGGPIDESAFAHYTGFKKYFNAETTFGKRNCVIATFGGSFLLYWLIKSRLNKKRALAVTAAESK
ncbi:ATP synthase F(0) complex subunit k, mitochondrial-like [Glandiceps talaboti]